MLAELAVVAHAAFVLFVWRFVEEYLLAFLYPSELTSTHQLVLGALSIYG